MNKFLTLFLVAGIAIVSGCTPPQDELDAPDAPPSPVSPPASTPSALEIPMLSEPGTISLQSLRGKVVVLDFWASWNSPSIREREALAQIFRNADASDIAFLGLCLDTGDTEDVSKALDRFDIPYPVGHATPTVQEAFPALRVVPAQWVLDRQGRVYEIVQGPLDSSALERVIQNALTN